ncbi:MAG TPA: dihydrofolate reductase family protein [Thermomicrobiales bacterium]|nr:dihydrofolate reductase family protein [Thermomicrobiales bacterium]
MGQIAIDKSISLDGFITGPNPTPALPLGEGGDAIFAWMMAAGPVPDTLELSEAWDEEVATQLPTTGAVIMGKRMWEMIESPNGWVAPDGTAFPWPVFVLTHEAREPQTLGITHVTYVNDGPHRALELARELAGERNIGIAGGNVCQQFLNMGVVDTIVLHIVPVFLGGGVRLFDNLEQGIQGFECASARLGNGVTHLTFTRRSSPA